LSRVLSRLVLPNFISGIITKRNCQMATFFQRAGTNGRRAAKLAASFLFYSVGWLWRRMCQLAGKTSPGTCVVLYYHAVPSEHRARFARQMKVLLRCAKPVKAERETPLEDGVHHAAVVFHDAFVSVCDNALPELASLGIPCTLFVPSGYLGQQQGWITDPNHSDYREAVVDADRLKSFDQALVSIGSHTVSHADLPALSHRQAREELDRSRTSLEAILGRKVSLFAFPYGRFNSELTNLSRQVGYQRVFTIRPEMAFSTAGEYVTGSCGVSATDWEWEFKLKLLGAYHWLPWMYGMRSKAGAMLRVSELRVRKSELSGAVRPAVEPASTGGDRKPGRSDP
jgi:peptidoglycan/xylan/chitin deacetylase (PgdA/CDA1 family)